MPSETNAVPDQPEIQPENPTMCEYGNEHVIDNDEITRSVIAAYGRVEEWCYDHVDDHTWTCYSCDQCFWEAHHSYIYCAGEQYCEDCIRDVAYWCDTCDEWEEDPDCPTAAQRSAARLDDYGYKPGPQHKFAIGESPTGVLTFGIELESENVQYRLEEAICAFRDDWTRDDFYLKYDGSLNNGMEIVSHPRSLESWREIARDLNQTMIGISNLGQRAWNRSNAGLHVHVGRGHFTNSHAMRLVMLFSRNEHDWVRIANRRSSYARFDGLNGSAAIKVKAPHAANHTDAVNLGANGGATIEFRIFRPSLAVGRVIGCIEFIHAAAEYTRNMTAHEAINGGLNFSNFDKFVRSNNYPMAIAILNNQRFTLENGIDPCA